MAGAEGRGLVGNRDRIYVVCITVSVEFPLMVPRPSMPACVRPRLDHTYRTWS
jgi:hypothetical protein